MKLTFRTLLAVALLFGAARPSHAQIVWGGGGVGASAPRVDPVTTVRSPHVRMPRIVQMPVFINGVLQTNRLSVDSGGSLSAAEQTATRAQVPSHASGGSWNGSQPVWGGGSPAPAISSGGTARATPHAATLRNATSSPSVAAQPARRPARIEWGTPTVQKGSPVP